MGNWSRTVFGMRSMLSSCCLARSAHRVEGKDGGHAATVLTLAQALEPDFEFLIFQYPAIDILQTNFFFIFTFIFYVHYSINRLSPKHGRGKYPLCRDG